MRGGIECALDLDPNVYYYFGLSKSIGWEISPSGFDSWELDLTIDLQDDLLHSIGYYLDNCTMYLVSPFKFSAMDETIVTLVLTLLECTIMTWNSSWSIRPTMSCIGCELSHMTWGHGTQRTRKYECPTRTRRPPELGHGGHVLYIYIYIFN